MSDIVDFMVASSRNLVRAVNRRFDTTFWGREGTMSDQIGPALSPEEWSAGAALTEALKDWWEEGLNDGGGVRWP